MSKHYLSGAKWTLKNESFEYNGTLDENGRTDLNKIALGTYEFTLSKKGYQTKKETVVIGTDPINIKAELQPLPKEKKIATRETVTKKSEKKETVKEEKPAKKEAKKETKTKSKAKKTTKKTTAKKKSAKTTKKDKDDEVKDKEDKKSSKK